MPGTTEKRVPLSPLLPAAIANTRARLPRLKETYSALFHEVASVFGWKLLPPLIYGALGIGFQVLALGIIYQFSKALIQDKPLVYWGLTISPRESLWILGGVAALALALLVLSAFFSYIYNSRAVTMSCALEKHCMKSFLGTVAKARSISVPKVEESDEGSLVKILMNDTRACGRSFLLAFTAIIPAITFIFGAGTLFLLQWHVTVMLVIVLACFFGALYRVNVFGVESSRNMEKFGSQVRKQYRDSIGFLRENSFSWDSKTPWSSQEEDAAVDGYLKSYGGLFGLSYRSSLVGDLFLALTLAAVFFGLSATSIMGKSHHWGVITAYLVGLQYAIRYLKQTINSLTLCNRFFPQVSRYFSTRRVAADDASLREEKRPAFTATAHAASPFASKTVRIARGEPTLLLAPKGVSRYSVSEMLSGLTAAKNPGAKLFPRHRVAILSGAVVGDKKALKSRIQKSPVLAQLRQEMQERKGRLFEMSQLLAETRVSELLSAGDPSAPEDVERETLRKACFTMALLDSALHAHSWVFLNAADLRDWDAAERRNLLTAWRDQFVFVFHRDLSAVADPNLPFTPTSPAVVFDPSRDLLWAGTLEALQAEKAAIASYLASPDLFGTDTPLAPEDEDLDLADI